MWPLERRNRLNDFFALQPSSPILDVRDNGFIFAQRVAGGSDC